MTLGDPALEPSWMALLPPFPVADVRQPGEFAFKDGSQRSGLLQLFDDVSAEVVARRFETGLAEEGWTADETDEMTFVHPRAGVRITLAVDEPETDHVVVLITAETL